MKKENIALIGYGYCGKKLYNHLKEGKLFNLSYVYFPSLKSETKKSIHKKYGREFTSSIEDIWKDTDVPNVIMATPIDTHYSVTKEALLHSKNVLVEKPLTLKLKDAISLKKIAKENNLSLVTEYTYTFSRALHKARQIVNDNTIGPIKSINIIFKQLGRFLNFDVFALLGSHALSILDLFVPLNQCTFSSKVLMKTNRLATASLIRFDSKKHNIRGYIDVSLHCPVREKKVIIYGEKGTIIYDQYAKNTLVVTIYSRNRHSSQKDIIRKEKHFDFDESNNLRHAIENFYKIIKGRQSGNLESAISVTSILELLG